MLKHCWGQTKQVVCLEVSLWLWIPASSPRTSKDWGSRRLLGIPSWTDPGDCGAETPEGKRCWLLLRCFTITVHVWSGETAYTLIQYFPLSDTHYLSISTSFQGFSGGSNGKESACNVGETRDSSSVHPWVGKIPWRPTSVLLPGGLHGQRSLMGYSPWGHKE